MDNIWVEKGKNKMGSDEQQQSPSSLVFQSEVSPLYECNEMPEDDVDQYQVRKSKTNQKRPNKSSYFTGDQGPSQYKKQTNNDLIEKDERLDIQKKNFAKIRKSKSKEQPPDDQEDDTNIGTYII